MKYDRYFLRWLAGTMFFVVPVLASISWASQSPKPVFIRSNCKTTLSSGLLQNFKQQLRDSRRYTVVSTVDDNGKMDVVLQVDVSCAEHGDLTAIASVYGIAKCFGAQNCHVTMDGDSLTAILCDSNGISNCGRLLFRSFDGYVARVRSQH